MKTSLLLLLLVVQAVAMPATATAVHGGSKPRSTGRRVHGGWKYPIDNVDEIYPGMKIYGGWKPIYNIDDPEIQGLGEWAVSKHVKRGNDGLKFVKVVSGEKQQVSGMNYWLIIQAINGNCESGTYKARVHDDQWRTSSGLRLNTLKLVSFDPVN